VIACSAACKQQPILEKMVYDCIEHSVSVCTEDATKTNLRIKTTANTIFGTLKLSWIRILSREMREYKGRPK